MPTSNELRIAVVDDIEKDRFQIAEQTRDILVHAKISHSISGYGDARSLLDDIHSGKKYDLLLLDVLMDDIDGMALAKALRNQGDHTMIVFISISQEMARLGYQVEASRYLVKPLDKEELKESLMYCIDKLTKKEILLPTEKGQYRTSFQNIQFVEAFDRGTRFVLTDDTVETKLKFSEVEAMLPKSTFILCHRAYIVNLALTKHISQYEFVMKNGAVIPISRLRYNEIYRKFVDRLTD
ncbi:MAG: response regulator transcription factor [Oscillospiraceae bacterium]|nr:response regulator transcription factor [Oscillospiraceae bacterium]